MRNITLIFSVLALSSCINIGANIKLTKGDIEERTIIIAEGATALVTSHGADVTVDYSLRPNEVRVKTHSDMFDILKVEVEDSTLSIGTKQNSLYAKTFEVRIPALAYNDIAVLGGSDLSWCNCTAESLTITASGGSDVELNGGIFNTLSITTSGGADVEIKGQCTDLSVTASGGTDTDLSELFAEKAIVSASGGSDVSVNASKSLTIDASGGADVYYSGMPTTTNINTSGGASIHRE